MQGPEPSPETRNVETPWWDLEPPNALVAAYQAGRLVNRLNNYLQIAVLFRDDIGRKAQTTITYLTGVWCHLLPERWQSNANHLKSVFQDWRSASIDNIAVVEQLIEEEAENDDMAPWVIRARFVRDYVTPTIEEVRNTFLRGLNGRAKSAFMLGEVVDQLVFRNDVYQYKYRPPQHDVGNDPTCPQTNSWIARLEAIHVQNEPLAPGDLPPDEASQQCLRILCEQAEMSAEVLNASTELASASCPEELLAGVETIDARIRERLAELGGACGISEQLQGSQCESASVVPGRSATVSSSMDSRENEPITADRAEPLSSGEYERLLKIKEDITKRKQTDKRKQTGKQEQTDEYIGESVAILRVFEKIQEFNRLPNKPVLILGPTGSGKTEISKLIHQSSCRNKSQFVSTHATDVMARDKAFARTSWQGYGLHATVSNANPKGQLGHVEQARGGTIFLDEVAELPEWFQTFLLQVLDGRKIPLFSGEGDPDPPDVRMIFATNEDPDQLVEQGKLRRDFYDRICRNRLTIPALKDRRVDVFSFARAKCDGHKITSKFWLCMLRYDWPGNVREILDVMDKAVARTSGKEDNLTIDLLDLKDNSITDTVNRMSEEEAEREVYQMLKQELTAVGFAKGVRGSGLIAQMAEVLEVSEATCSRKYKEYCDQ